MQTRFVPRVRINSNWPFALTRFPLCCLTVISGREWITVHNIGAMRWRRFVSLSGNKFSLKHAKTQDNNVDSSLKSNPGIGLTISE